MEVRRTRSTETPSHGQRTGLIGEPYHSTTQTWKLSHRASRAIRTSETIIAWGTSSRHRRKVGPSWSPPVGGQGRGGGLNLSSVEGAEDSSVCKYPDYITNQKHPTLPYYIPFRALTSANVSNALFAGKSTTCKNLCFMKPMTSPNDVPFKMDIQNKEEVISKIICTLFE